jgi:hypothetical protein
MNSTIAGLSRREFLQNVSLGVAGFAAGGTVFGMATTSSHPRSMVS